MQNLLAQAGQERKVRRPVLGTPQPAATQFDLRNVAGNIGLFRLPREEDAVCVPKRVSPEK